MEKEKVYDNRKRRKGYEGTNDSGDLLVDLKNSGDYSGICLRGENSHLVISVDKTKKGYHIFLGNVRGHCIEEWGGSLEILTDEEFENLEIRREK